MVSPTTERSPRLSAFAAFGAIALTACAVLPERSYPDFRDHHLAADYVVPLDGRILVPATTRDLIVQELELLPPPLGETFDADGARWMLYDHGTNVRLRGRFRAYGTGAGDAVTPTQLLPGAQRIEVLPANQ